MLFTKRAFGLVRSCYTRAMDTHTAVVLRNEVEIPYIAKEALLASSQGVYTTARTIDKTFVMEFDAHVARLADSSVTHWKTHFALPSLAAQDIIKDPKALRPHVYRSFHHALLKFEEHFPHLDCERRITLLLDWVGEKTSHGFSITTYTEPLPKPPSAPVEVKIGRCPPSRHGKVAKDAQWTRDRQDLEAQMGSANEVVMVDDDDYLLEGTQSNIFVVMHDKVLTPDREDILEGTIRKAIRRVSAEHNVPLVLTPHIPLSSIGSWQAAFLTSTSRMVLPIKSCIFLPSVVKDESQRIAYDIPSHPLVTRIAELVRADCHTGSVDVSKDAE